MIYGKGGNGGIESPQNKFDEQFHIGCMAIGYQYWLDTDIGNG